MQWTIAEARQRFSELVRGAASEPQVITNRNRPVAALVDSELFRQFQEWQHKRQRSVLAAFQELTQICAEEEYWLAAPTRSNRINPLPDVLDELSAGHQRS